ncbi:MAG: proteobacterial dedicated sortase system response regulator [Gammaproteobacteria bacterium]|nr:proteobacterial dedicated sortase system response regulator [Gammaproteobacteria bacterium]
MAKTIAIVEDEPAIRENYAASLRKQGYQVEMYGNRPAALAAFNKKLPDLALLDIGLENEIDGGFELCRSLRSISSTLPIIFLTARDSDLDIISGLRLGADDYLTKDISIPNLCARVAAFFRRQELLSAPPAKETIIKRNNLTMDMNRFSVHWKDQPVDLTLTEFWMVHTLVLHPGHVKNREQLMQDAKIVVDDATITSHIKRIRKKFQVVDKSFDCVDTVYGMGYRWVEQ